MSKTGTVSLSLVFRELAEGASQCPKLAEHHPRDAYSNLAQVARTVEQAGRSPLYELAD